LRRFNARFRANRLYAMRQINRLLIRGHIRGQNERSKFFADVTARYSE
jgi:hypothetical protein